jgi:hypothetical protein
MTKTPDALGLQPAILGGAMVMRGGRYPGFPIFAVAVLEGQKRVALNMETLLFGGIYEV